MRWPRPTAGTTDVGSGPPRRSGPWPAVDRARARMEVASPPGGGDTAGESGDPQATRARGRSGFPSRSVARTSPGWSRGTRPRPTRTRPRGASPTSSTQYDADAGSGRALPFAIEVEGRLVGQMTIGSIVLGSFRSCFAGYWVSRAVAGRMVTPTALALAADHAVGTLGLHRIEVNIRPENTASLAVVRKLGFRAEGLRPHYLHIAGAWRDHLSFALTTEDLAGRDVHRPARPDHLRWGLQRKPSRHSSHMRDTPRGVRRPAREHTYGRSRAVPFEPDLPRPAGGVGCLLRAVLAASA